MKRPIKGNPMPNEQLLTAAARATQLRKEARAKEKAGDHQWWMVEQAIKAFMAEYPYDWIQFQNEMAAERTKYNEATEGGLKKSNFRRVASFPVINRYNPESRQYEQIDSLLPVLEKIIPGLTHKKSKNFTEFLKRFPQFRAGEKVGHSETM